MYEVGRSFEGRPILQITLTNEATGPATDKPAAYFEGGRHSGEITGSESVLWLMQHLLAGYGSDPEITTLLDTKARLEASGIEVLSQIPIDLDAKISGMDLG